MKTIVEIEWDKPAKQAWLNADNISVALSAYYKNTRFHVRTIQASTELDEAIGRLQACGLLTDSEARREKLRLMNIVAEKASNP